MDGWIRDWRQKNQHKQKKRRLNRFYIIVLLVLCVAAAGFASSYKRVTIIVDGETMQVDTLKRTVGQLFKEKEIEALPKDRLSVDLETIIINGMSIEINRAFPVYIEADGRVMLHLTQPGMVENIIKDAKIAIGERDEVEPGLQNKIERRGSMIKITRITTEYFTESVVLPKDIRYRNDPGLERGKTKVLVSGSDGLQELRYEVTYADGIEIARELIEEIIVVEPVARLIARGTMDAVNTVNTGSVSRSYSRSLTMTATAYTHTGNPTYSGSMPERGVVAVDPKLIPLGTQLYVEGYGLAVAKDIGGTITGRRIDLFMDTREEALRWGVRNVRVYILD